MPSFFSLVYELTQGDNIMLSFILGLLIGIFVFMLIDEHKARLITLWQHPRWWRAILACPHAEPLHYHHDGCPACDM